MSEPEDRENYHDYSVDDEDQPQSTGDSLTGDDGREPVDPLDTGYSPPEKWSAAQKWGNTPLEEQLGESLEQRLAQENLEVDPYVEAAGMTTEEIEGETDDSRQVGDQRAGRLVAPDEGAGDDIEKDEIATDVGIDGAAAGAEEAAMHVIDQPND